MTQTLALESRGLTLRFCFAFITSLLALTLVWVVLLSHPVLGFSPHGGFTSDTDKCSSCHRMHNSKAAALLPTASVVDFCYSCHAKGQGADTSVREGGYYDGNNNGHGWGVDNGALLGGGFMYTGEGIATTGGHQLGVLKSPPGANPNGNVYALTCIDCHTPHEGPNYRLLRQQPGGTPNDISVPWNGPWTDATETARGGDYKAFTERDFTSTDGVTEVTRNYQSGIAAWCTACHTHYYATWSGTTANAYKAYDVYDAGDIYGNVARFRHTVNIPITNRVSIEGASYDLTSNLPLEDATGNGRTSDDRLTCLSCHKSHGTAAAMTGPAVLEPRGPLPSGLDGLSLRMNGRGICADCHKIGVHD